MNWVKYSHWFKTAGDALCVSVKREGFELNPAWLNTHCATGASDCISKPQFPHLWGGDDNARHSGRHKIFWAALKLKIQAPVSAVCFWELQSVLGGEEKPVWNQEVFLCKHFC